MAGLKVLIVAGGTGGHIFPALAFGEWLTAQKKADRVTYLSGNRPLELEIYRSRGVDSVCLPLRGSPLGTSSPAQIYDRCMGLLRAFFQTRKILSRERPDICFLFGGYVSLMPLLWCHFLKIPAVVHEQNAYAGRVTRLASRMGATIASGWQECRGISGPVTPAGIPVRPLRKIARRDAARLLGVGVDDDDLVIGIVGGSLGSASLNTLPENVKKTQGMRRVVFVVLGENRDAAVDPSVCFVGRRWDMTPFYSLVDGVICRAGASTLAELAAYDIPALAVPWAGAADGHQEANARCFAAITSNPVWFENGEEDLQQVFSKLISLCEAKKYCGEGPVIRVNAAPVALWRLSGTFDPDIPDSLI